MDIKSARQDYQQITEVKGSGERAWESAQLLLESGIAHEFRTTVHPDMLDNEQLTSLVNELIKLGADNYVIQECVTGHCLDEKRRVTAAPTRFTNIVEGLDAKFPVFSVRTV